MRLLFAVDPGYEQSALVVYDGSRVLEHGTFANAALLQRISDRVRKRSHLMVIEQIASFGMPVGEEVFETVFWSGRFAQAWAGYHAEMPVDRLKRHAIKMHLCGQPRAKDGNIRQALIDRFGPSKEKAIGRKATQGPLYGLSGDAWAALAVAVTYWDLHLHTSSERTSPHASATV